MRRVDVLNERDLNFHHLKVMTRCVFVRFYDKRLDSYRVDTLNERHDEVP